LSNALTRRVCTPEWKWITARSWFHALLALWMQRVANAQCRRFRFSHQDEMRRWVQNQVEVRQEIPFHSATAILI